MPIDSRMLPPHIQKQILRKIAEQDAAKKSPPKPMNKPKMVNPLESMTEIQSNPQSGKCFAKYVIYGNPITKKNSSQILTNSKTGRPFVSPSKQYKAYEKAAEEFLFPIPEVPFNKPHNLKVLYYMQTRRIVDLANLLGATCDILVKHGIIEDDNTKIVVSHDGSRVYYDKENPRAEIYLEEV